MRFQQVLRGVASLAHKAADARRSSTAATRSIDAPAATTAKPGKLQISYEPALDGDADPGEVVWAWIPYEDDPSQGKDRPCLVIGRLDGRLAVVALTTKATGPDRDRVSVGIGLWDHERRPSFAKIDRIILLQPNTVRREGAVFAKDRFDSVVAATAARRPDLQRA